MAHLLLDVYDWYTDLMDNRSGELEGIEALALIAMRSCKFSRSTFRRSPSQRLAHDAITAAYFRTLFILCLLL